MRVARPVRLFLACLFAGLISLPAARGQGGRETRDQALKLYAAGRYQEALPYFDQVLARHPRDLDALNKRGCILIRLNQPEKALADFNKATQYSAFLDLDRQQADRGVAPDVVLPLTANPYWSATLYPSAFTNRGIALLMLGRTDEAMADFRHSIDLRTARPIGDPGWAIGLAAAHGGLGQAWHRKGDDLQSLAAYDQALRYNPGDPNAMVGRGIALSSMNRFDEAFSAFDAAIRIDPNNARAYGHRGATLDLLRRYDQALADFDRALRLDPNSVTVLRLRAALNSRLGKNIQALADLDAAIRVDPSDTMLFKDRGGVLNRMGDHARALRDLDESLRLDPKNARALQNRAAAHNSMGRFDLALQDCNNALRIEPRNGGVHNNRGLALIGLERPDEAVADLNEAIKLQPGLIAARVNRGNAYTRLGLLDRAADDFREALRAQPNLAVAEAGLQAITESQRTRIRTQPMPVLVHEDPFEAARYRTLGDARRASGDWSGAAADYGRAVEADAKDTEAYASRGWARLCAGEPGAEADARAWLELKTWRDPFAPYMALLGIIAARAEGHTAQADAFLAEALANTRPPAWPAPMFRYLKRTVPSTEFLAATQNPEQQAEAETVVGLDLLLRGERAAALEHLRWVRDHGPEGSIARDVATAALTRAASAAKVASGR